MYVKCSEQSLVQNKRPVSISHNYSTPHMGSANEASSLVILITSMSFIGLGSEVTLLLFNVFGTNGD